jgi:mevalonate kinase
VTTYRSNGKLLLTAEYVVLDGANALALPTKYGQSLTVEPFDKPQLNWKSIDHNGEIWFEALITLEKIASKFSSPSSDLVKRVIEILHSAIQLNSEFLKNDSGFKVTTKLDFPNNWGLGSSSTLINNIANWANVDAYQLLELTFGGSGYDIACAQYNNPITYQNNPDKTRTVNSITFNPRFKNELFFVHLNQKQNSRHGIEHYKTNKQNVTTNIKEIDSITHMIINCLSISEFETLITAHEQIISKIINLPTVKLTLFPDYSRAIKSLGAWGGDFVLATGGPDDMSYFKNKGYQTIIPYSEMIL